MRSDGRLDRIECWRRSSEACSIVPVTAIVVVAVVVAPSHCHPLLCSPRPVTQFPSRRRPPPLTVTMVKDRKPKSADVVTREYTIHLHKHVHGKSFKKRAPKAVDAVRKFARTTMGTADVRLDTQLNKEVWRKGVRNVPRRLRVRLSRRRNEDEDAKEPLYTLVTAVKVPTFKGLQTQTIDE